MPPKEDSSAKRGSVGANGQIIAEFSFKSDLLSLNYIGLIFLVLKKNQTFEDVKYLKIGRLSKIWIFGSSQRIRMLSIPHGDKPLNMLMPV